MLSKLRESLAEQFPRIARWARAGGDLARRCERALRPGVRAWNGAALGLAALTFVILGMVILQGAMLPMPNRGRTWEVLSQVAGAAAGGAALLFAAWAFAKLPRRFRWSLAFCGVVLFALFGNFTDAGPRIFLYLVAAGSLAGAGWAVTSGGGMRDTTIVQRVVAVVGLAVGVGALVVAFVWVADLGMEPVEVRNAAAEAVIDELAVVSPLELPDPSEAGPYAVLTLTYGSGEDINRREFGRDADLITEPVDGSKMLERWSGDEKEERTRFWGFDRDELPLQGRVWYPGGEGPFPLVLIVHGNHSMQEFSDPGYGYLGELLASRGMILVSIDENFINGSLREENDARGWLLLEHLRQWREWNEAEEGPFAGKVDLGRIGLMGHSRGGEAVAVAAAFNRLPHYPDDATLEFDYGFDIGAIIAIAPAYGQYRPGGRLTRLTDVNYMSIHGANDGDVTSFMGMAQFENVSFSGAADHAKATVYVYGANHGQFNTVWGDQDWGLPFGYALNRQALISGEEQRQAGKVFMMAWLEAHLRAETGYLDLFVDPRRGGDWLPDTVYLTEFADSNMRYVATFEEDVDVTTGTMPGSATRGEGLSRWREDRLALKFRDKETSAVYVGWFNEEEDDDEADAGGDDSYAEDIDDSHAEDIDDSHAEGDESPGTGEDAADEGESEPEGPARYVITLPDGYDTSFAAELVMSVADADEDPEPEEEDSDGDNEDGDNGEQGDSNADGDNSEHGDSNADDEPDDAGDRDSESDHAAEQDDDAGSEDSADEDPDDDSDDDSDEDPEEDSDSDEDGDGDEDEPREPIDFTVRLTDGAGNVADVPISRFSYVQPQLPVQIIKNLFGEEDEQSEPVPQIIIMPISWFREANPDLQSDSLRSIEFVFDRSGKAVIILDNVGFR